MLLWIDSLEFFELHLNSKLSIIIIVIDSLDFFELQNFNIWNHIWVGACVLCTWDTREIPVIQLTADNLNRQIKENYIIIYIKFILNTCTTVWCKNKQSLILRTVFILLTYDRDWQFTLIPVLKAKLYTTDTKPCLNYMIIIKFYWIQ